MEKKESKTQQRVNLFLNPILVKKAKIQALKKGISLSQLIDNLVRELKED